MRRLSIAALLAVPLLLLVPSGKAAANPPTLGFGACDHCLGLFKNIHQHGPLFNYGPYYGYYPFAPYGPWDAYLRYDPFFYGDPYANWVPKDQRRQGNEREARERDAGDTGNRYGRNQNLPEFSRLRDGGGGGRGLGGGGGHGFGHGHNHGFHHASWLHGGWFRGHQWTHGHGLHTPSCSSCGGISQATAVELTGDVAARYSGFGSPDQSAVFYPATPTLNPVLDLLPVGAVTK